MMRDVYICDRCGIESSIPMTDNIGCSFGRLKGSRTFLVPPFQRKHFCAGCEINWNETFYNSITDWWTNGP